MRVEGCCGESGRVDRAGGAEVPVGFSVTAAAEEIDDDEGAKADAPSALIKTPTQTTSCRFIHPLSSVARLTPPTAAGHGSILVYGRVEAILLQRS